MAANIAAVDPRTRKAATLLAAGSKPDEVAKALRLPKQVLATWQRSPLFQELVEFYKTEIEERGVQATIDELVAGSRQNLNFVKSVVNGDFTDNPERMGIRLRAALKLMDKAIPDANTRQQAADVSRILIDGRLLGQALRAMKNVDVIDMTEQEIEDATGTPLNRVPVFSADEAEQEHRERSEDE
jgi:hypothetical protein